jgi:hypothetical protein
LKEGSNSLDSPSEIAQNRMEINVNQKEGSDHVDASESTIVRDPQEIAVALQEHPRIVRRTKTYGNFSSNNDSKLFSYYNILNRSLSNANK